MTSNPEPQPQQHAASATQLSARRPTVLFLCEHNAGRSQLAAGLTAHRGAGKVTVRSAGTAPDDKVSDIMLDSLAEVGIHWSNQVLTRVSDALVRQADLIGALKPGLGIDHPADVPYETWPLPDPANWDVDGIRPLRDHLDQRVRDLIERLTSDGAATTAQPDRTSDGTLPDGVSD